MSRASWSPDRVRGSGGAIALRVARDGFTVVVHYHGDAEGAEETMI